MGRRDRAVRPDPGPPGRDEAEWYDEWLDEGRGSGIIYVPRDYDAQAEYWQGVLEAMPKTADASLRAGREASRSRQELVEPIAAKAKEPADADEWFTVEDSPGSPTVCKTLGGPWADGIDPVQASLTRHETFKVDAEGILLEGDGKTLAMEWHRADDAGCSSSPTARSCSTRPW